MMFEIGSDTWPGLSKLIEEQGEVAQVIGKLMGTQGVEQHWDGTNLRERITDEIGDVLAAIQFVVDHCDLNAHRVAMRAEHKRDLFEKWHREQTAKALTVDQPPCTGQLVHDEFTACPRHD